MRDDWNTDTERKDKFTFWSFLVISQLTREVCLLARMCLLNVDCGKISAVGVFSRHFAEFLQHWHKWRSGTWTKIEDKRTSLWSKAEKIDSFPVQNIHNRDIWSRITKIGILHCILYATWEYKLKKFNKTKQGLK